MGAMRWQELDWMYCLRSWNNLPLPERLLLAMLVTGPLVFLVIVLCSG